MFLLAENLIARDHWGQLIAEPDVLVDAEQLINMQAQQHAVPVQLKHVIKNFSFFKRKYF